MKRVNSAEYAVLLTNGLAIDEMPFGNRSDKWWDMFWHNLGIAEAQDLKESI